MARVVDPLDEAIDGLYVVFEAYPLRGWTEPCLHCHTQEDERAVHRRPLRELRSDDLAGFAADSLMTWGEVVDYKHFLPRLFEIVAKEGFPDDYPDIETVVGALDRGEWRTWPRPEQAAVDGFLAAFWRTHLTNHPALHDTDTVLSAVATAADDMGPFLDAWLDTDGTAPAVHFGEFLVANTMDASAGTRLSNPWLRNRNEQETQVREWLLAVAARFVPRLESAFLDARDEQTLEMLDLAIDVARRTTTRLPGTRP